MSDDHKKRVMDALLKFHEKDHKEIRKLSGLNTKRKKNMKPEKLVEEACLKWMRDLGWEVQIIESKAVWNKAAGCYTQNQSVKTGNADCQGIMPDGTSVAVEFKAPGRLNTFLSDRRVAQRDFIIRRIHMHGFACVVDSVDKLSHIYKQWCEYRAIDKECAKQYLLSCLPVRKKAEAKVTPKDDLGF